MVADWLSSRPVDRLPAVHKLLSYPPREVEAACQRALDFGEKAPRTVFNILRQKPVGPPPSAQPYPTQAQYGRQASDLVGRLFSAN